LLSAQAGEAHRAAQFPGLRVLPARDVDGFLDGRLGLVQRSGAGEQGLALEPIELGFERRSPRSFPPPSARDDEPSASKDDPEGCLCEIPMGRQPPKLAGNKFEIAFDQGEVRSFLTGVALD
jgi:hypothetical protein